MSRRVLTLAIIIGVASLVFYLWQCRVNNVLFSLTSIFIIFPSSCGIASGLNSCRLSLRHGRLHSLERERGAIFMGGLALILASIATEWAVIKGTPAWNAPCNQQADGFHCPLLDTGKQLSNELSSEKTTSPVPSGPGPVSILSRPAHLSGTSTTAIPKPLPLPSRARCMPWRKCPDKP